MYSSYASNIDSIPFHLGPNDSSSSSSSELTPSSAERSFLTPGDSRWADIWQEWPLLCPFGSLFTALWRPGGGSAGGSKYSLAPPVGIQTQKTLSKMSLVVFLKFDSRGSHRHLSVSAGMFEWTAARTGGSAVRTPQSLFSPRREVSAAGLWVGRGAAERWPAGSGLFCSGTSGWVVLEDGEEPVAAGLEAGEGFRASDFGVQGEHYRLTDWDAGQLYDERKQRSGLKVLAHRVWNFHMRFFSLSYSASFPIKMHATDTKMQKIEPGPFFLFFFYDGWKFRRQCVNVIDTTWGHIYFLTWENFRQEFRTLKRS